MRIRALCALLALSSCAPSFAEAVPNCWKPGVVEGSYLVSLDARKATLEQLLELLERARGRNLEPSWFPYAFARQKFLYFEVHAVDHNVQKLSKEELRHRVESDLEAFVAIPGVAVACDPSGPLGSIEP